MMLKLYPIALLLFAQFGIAQSVIKGKLLDDGFVLGKAEVINITTKRNSSTDSNGEFVIQAKVNDSLYFMATGYQIKKIKLSSTQFESKNLVINMIRKAEELSEVRVTKVDNLKFDENYKKTFRQQTSSGRHKSVPGVYDGSLVNAVDFVQIGKSLWNLLGIESKAKKETIPKVEFAALAKNALDQAFYLNILKLKEEEVDLFLQYCTTDPASQKLNRDSNTLQMMDFLMAKNKEFQKAKIDKTGF